jgi:hypothetical protein
MGEQIVFTRGVPPPEAFPTAELGECLEAAVREDPNVVLQYGQQPGYAPLREELAKEYGVSPVRSSSGTARCSCRISSPRTWSAPARSSTRSSRATTARS